MATSPGIVGRSPGVVTCLLVGLLATALIGCGTGTPSAHPSAAGSSGVNLPDLGLTNVKTETASARGATIGLEGGTLAATGSNGAVYTLTIPQGALIKPETIGLYPVGSVANLPGGVAVTAGVQFSPDGLALQSPAILSISLPSSVDAATLSGVSWNGDAAVAHGDLAIMDGSVASLTIFHFSGAGLTPGSIPPPSFNCAVDEPICLSEEFDAAMAQAAKAPNPRAEMLTTLRAFYHATVNPTFLDSTSEAGARPVEDSVLGDSFIDATPYHHFLAGISNAQRVLNDPTFTVSPELGASKPLAIAFLRAWFEALNQGCADRADNPETALEWSAYGVLEHYAAEQWGIASKANDLEYEDLLDEACARLTIDPDRSFSASQPGDAGKVELSILVTIATEPIAPGTIPVQVEIGLTGSNAHFTKLADGDGKFSADLTWPQGTDPVKIDIRATAVLANGGLPILTEVARFDRITKGSGPGRIAFISITSASSYALSVMDADGSNVRRVIDSGNGGPAWSPDGSKVALPVTGADGKPAIEIVENLTDSSTTAVATPVPGTSGGSRPTWLPDGRIMFEIGGHGLWVVGTDGAGLQQLIAIGYGASVSPDGSQIAFVIPTGDQSQGPHYEIHLRAIGGGPERTLLNDPNIGPSTVTWSPDGTKLAFYGWVKPDGHYDVFVMDADGSPPTQLTFSGQGSGSFGPSWSPDGKSIVFESDREVPAGIYIMNADGSGQKLILKNGLLPAWQP